MTHPRSFFWLRVAATPESMETRQYRLMEMGALGTEEEDCVPPVVRAWFQDAAGCQAAREALGAQQVLAWGESPWEDWDRSWRERQTPVAVTPELTVCPPWVEAPAEARHVIRLEAKMAFGTGAHESTRIAAELLERVELAGASLLDVGTGTGILALYAARRGARPVVGFDIDPVTGPCLRENADRNPPPEGHAPVFYVGTLDALLPDVRFDVILANMIRTEIRPHLDEVLRRAEPGARLVFSGQRVEDQPHWMPWLAANGLAIAAEITIDGWWGFAAKRGQEKGLRA